MLTDLEILQLKVMDTAVKDARPVALLEHSMATDILVRVAASLTNVGPIVLISAFSKEIDTDTPNNLLHVTGAWEPGLRQFALKSLQMVDPRALEGKTATQGPVSRRAVVAPFTEHVSVLQSTPGWQEALVWLDQLYGRTSAIIPSLTNQNPLAQSRQPMDLIRSGSSISLFQASQHSATMSS